MKALKPLLLCMLLLALALSLAACGRPGFMTAKEPAFTGPLLEFEASRNNAETIDLSGAKALLLGVNHCEYGEPT